MKRMLLILCLAGVLGGCGADGEPVQPQLSTSVSVGTGGVSTAASLSVNQGPFTLGVSL